MTLTEQDGAVRVTGGLRGPLTASHAHARAHACAHACTRPPLLSADELGAPDASFSLELCTIGSSFDKNNSRRTGSRDRAGPSWGLCVWDT